MATWLKRGPLAACIAMAGTGCWATDPAAPAAPRTNADCNAFAYRSLASIHHEFNLSRAQCEQHQSGSDPRLAQCYRQAAELRASREDTLNRERSACHDTVASRRSL